MVNDGFERFKKGMIENYGVQLDALTDFLAGPAVTEPTWENVKKFHVKNLYPINDLTDDEREKLGVLLYLSQTGIIPMTASELAEVVVRIFVDSPCGTEAEPRGMETAYKAKYEKLLGLFDSSAWPGMANKFDAYLTPEVLKDLKTGDGQELIKLIHVRKQAETEEVWNNRVSGVMKDAKIKDGMANVAAALGSSAFGAMVSAAATILIRVSAKSPEHVANWFASRWTFGVPFRTDPDILAQTWIGIGPMHPSLAILFAAMYETVEEKAVSNQVEASFRRDIDLRFSFLGFHLLSGMLGVSRISGKGYLEIATATAHGSTEEGWRRLCKFQKTLDAALKSKISSLTLAPAGTIPMCLLRYIRLMSTNISDDLNSRKNPFLSYLFAAIEYCYRGSPVNSGPNESKIAGWAGLPKDTREVLMAWAAVIHQDWISTSEQKIIGVGIAPSIPSLPSNESMESIEDLFNRLKGLKKA
ncbi:unnamed protein product, partial [Mesorhabditis belari]|uniref:Nucleoprotein n=1 Tax=Mesorhabditis belari TaxID=2138241 RepID=A0AAF3ESZ8_9BILA